MLNQCETVAMLSCQLVLVAPWVRNRSEILRSLGRLPWIVVDADRRLGASWLLSWACSMTARPG